MLFDIIVGIVVILGLLLGIMSYLSEGVRKQRKGDD